MTGATGKTVAIIVGGAAGVGFLVICLLFAKNLMKKKHDGTISSLLTHLDTCIFYSRCTCIHTKHMHMWCRI